MITLIMGVIIYFPGCISTHLNKIRQDISQLQREIVSLKQENQELNQKISNLQIALDDLERRIAKDQISSEEVWKELARIRESLGLKPSAPPQREVKKAVVAPPETASDFYSLAYEKFRHMDYTEAIKEFRTFINRFPESELIDIAHFWLGECYYALEDWSTAVAEYERLIKLYPFGNKVPDAYLKLGYCHLNQNDKLKALKNFQMVVDIFPHSKAATIAKEKISQLKQRK